MIRRAQSLLPVLVLLLALCAAPALSESSPHALPVRRAFLACVDGDPSCDADGTQNGVCTIALCVYVPRCPPGPQCVPGLELCFPHEQQIAQVAVRIARNRSRAHKGFYSAGTRTRLTTRCLRRCLGDADCTNAKTQGEVVCRSDKGPPGAGSCGPAVDLGT